MKYGESKVAVCTTVRNPNKKTEKRMLSVTKGIQKVCGFAVSEVVIVESDSEKKYGFSELREACEVTHIDMGKLRIQLPNRIERLSACRNKYVEEIQKRTVKPEILVVVDSDAGNFESVDFNLLLSSVKRGGAVFANWQPVYYDILALRADNWIDIDYRRRKPNRGAAGSSVLGKLSDYNFALKNMKRIRTQQREIKVKSAFGGLAFYRYDAVENLRYSASLNSSGFLESEHVGFHRKIAERGLSLRIACYTAVRGVNKHIIFWFLTGKFLSVRER